MKGKGSIYLTTTLPYVNGKPHMGHALEFVQADVIARYKRAVGFDVFFNTGTDEHGLKIYRMAEAEGIPVQEYVDRNAKVFDDFRHQLNLSFDNFIRTTDPHHLASAQEFWKICLKNGDIYKKMYSIKYCVGCELEKTDSELINGECPIHPGKKIENIEEENYFFRFSKYQQPLLDLYAKKPDFVIPESRMHEIARFVEDGLKDFSISRIKEKMPWGVSVPDDDAHAMYVWFDALVNYISAIGWPTDMEKFQTWWPVIQFAGKDNLRQQSAMWQAMLLSADLLPSEKIIIHGFVTSKGQKMSKSIGNVVDPLDIVAEYGVDALRYYLVREISTFEDGDFTDEQFKAAYNANLANGIGNLTARIMKMAETHLTSPVPLSSGEFPQEFRDALDVFDVQKAANVVWEYIGKLDRYIQETQPFKLIKENKGEGVTVIEKLVADLHEIGLMLAPFLPETAEKIITAIQGNNMPESLFVRK
ncbi:MAG: methionyl-tRNA synthetase [Parcubacteria group bacterium Greene0714_4]|nr:MAG: methionyl-tRNA synthetase [Parcubacteria group bacterium Greene0714_4]